MAILYKSEEIDRAYNNNNICKQCRHVNDRLRKECNRCTNNYNVFREMEEARRRDTIRVVMD